MKFSYSSMSRPPQTMKAREDQVQNNAGGFVFKLDPMKQLERFLILGSDSGSYYATPRKLTVENAEVVRRCWESWPQATAEVIKDVSTEGRAPKNSPAISTTSRRLWTPMSVRP